MTKQVPPWRSLNRPVRALKSAIFFIILLILILGPGWRQVKWLLNDTLADQLDTNFIFPVMGVGSIIGLFVIIIYAALRKLDYRRKVRLLNQAFASLSDNFLPPDEPLVLYLRSFAVERRARSRRLWEAFMRVLKSPRNWETSLVENSVDEKLKEPEERLEGALSDFCTFLAIGNKHDGKSALKLRISDEKWQEAYLMLCRRAQLIMCFIGTTPSSRWELSQIVNDERKKKRRRSCLFQNLCRSPTARRLAPT